MKKAFWLSATAIALATSGNAFAQQASDTGTTDPAAAAAPASDSGEVVVTAERRSVSAQRTGVAATVLTGEDLTRKAINTVEQLQFASPSLTVNTSGQSNSFNIRGIGKTEITSSIGVGVVTYRDGVATFPGYFQTEPYYDIASVEVLRGPQGTFAGGNATGGAVFITETNPNFRGVNGYVLGQYGNYDDVKVQGAVNLPLSETLAIRLAGNFEDRDTFFKVTGPWTGNPGNLRSVSARASLLWQPTTNFRVLIKGDYNHVNYGGFPATPAYSIIGGKPVANTADPFIVTSNAPLEGEDKFVRVSANISYTFDSGVVIRSITGYQSGNTNERIDSDGTAAGNPGVSVGNDTFRDDADERIWSQEVNIVSPDANRFTWLLGGYYQNDKYTFPSPNGYVALTPNSLLTSLRIVGVNPHTATAGFGQIGYKLTEGLQVTLGGRYSRTTSRNDAVFPVTVPLLGINTSIPQNDFTVDKKFDGKLALNWTIDPNHFLYAFAASGTKAGGLNGPNLFAVPPRAFKAERVMDYEIGYKGTLMDGHLRTQVGFYYNRYKNFQINIVDPTFANYNSIYNVPNPTTLYGFEAAAQGSFGGFQFDFSTSISRSKVGQFFAFDPRLAHAGTCNPTAGPATATCIDLGGRRQTYSPKFTFTAGAQYAIPLGEKLSLTPRLDYAHIGSVWGTLFERRDLGDYLEARNIFNGQLTLTSGDWSIAAYGTNLSNQHYIGSLNGNRRLPGAPRQYGLRISRSF